MKNAMQLKSKIKSLSTAWGIPAQAVLQTYFTERLLARIAASKHQPNFVFKGGFLISSIIGNESRSTMDLDATLQGAVLSEDILRTMFDGITSINQNDGITYEVIGVTEIREDDAYSGFRVSLTADYETITQPFHVDITTGDAITPCAINYMHQPLFDERAIGLLAYPLETIFSEKIEGILRRVDQNTRLRDYYDVHILLRQRKADIRPEVLRDAIVATARKNGRMQILDSIPERLEIISASSALRRYWSIYQAEYSYASGIDFDSVLASLAEVLQIAKLSR